MRTYQPLIAALLLTSLAATARADIAPPPGFEETCTLEKKARAGQECHLCRAYHGNHDHCSQSLSAFGFTQTCRARGASVWSEVWCRAEGPSAVKVPAPIIRQLADANGKPGPMPSGLPAASSTPSTSAPTPTPSAPSASPSSPPSPTPAASTKPAKPTPPAAPTAPKSKGCAMSHQSTTHASLFAAGAALVLVLRRRRR